MTTLEACRSDVDAGLDARGFSTRPLESFILPDTNTLPAPEGSVDFAVFGDPKAPKVIFQSAPYLTDLSSTGFRLRLATQQEVLGDDFCVVGVQAYDPRQNFSKSARQQLSEGIFTPLAERVQRVVAHLGLEDSQQLAFYGYSLGGDVAIQTANDSYVNPNHGIHPVAALGAVEYARSANRGLVKVVRAMVNSSGRYRENILASNSLALNEAAGLEEAEATKGINLEDIKGTLSYWLGNASVNLAITRGFGTNRGTRQLMYLIDHKKLPTVVGRQSQSGLIVEAAASWLRSSGAIYFEEDNDHSADDNIRESAARILYFARSAMAS